MTRHAEPGKSAVPDRIRTRRAIHRPTHAPRRSLSGARPRPLVRRRLEPTSALIATSGASYPSGHAIASAVTAIGIVMALTTGRRRLRWMIAAASIATAVALSRTYPHRSRARTHHPRGIRGCRCGRWAVAEIDAPAAGLQLSFVIVLAGIETVTEHEGRFAFVSGTRIGRCTRRRRRNRYRAWLSRLSCRSQRITSRWLCCRVRCPRPGRRSRHSRSRRRLA